MRSAIAAVSIYNFENIIRTSVAKPVVSLPKGLNGSIPEIQRKTLSHEEVQ